MPSTTPLQKAAFDAIDTLHFSQVFMSLIDGSPESDWYYPLLTRIYEMLGKAGISGKQAEITKHYLLCALEIYLSIDNKYISNLLNDCEKNNAGGTHYNREEHVQYVKRRRSFSLALLNVVARYNGVDEEFVLQAADKLINNEALALSTIPPIIRHRLVECCYALEYPHASLGFYHELVNRNIIACGKYSRKNDKYK
ncbi:hypothetical protein M2263_001501 [Providencia alcalifaciens]|nr:hypothetical protein [Providencia alcalifaciens]